MKYETVSLDFLANKKEWSLFICILFVVFILNLLGSYLKYHDFQKEELFKTSGQVLTIYKKENYDVLKIKTKNKTFFTSVSKDRNIHKMNDIDLVILTKGIDFISYIRGFYTKSFNVYLKDKNTDIKIKLYYKIMSQHENKQIAELFNAIFFAIPLSDEVRDFCAVLGISHLIAISGFHLGIMIIVLYWFFSYPYSYLHKRYFPFRNKKFDLLLICSCLLFYYLLFTNIVPSLLRSFLMFTFGLYLLRHNIKILSYETLCIITLVIIAIFPKYAFSLSLWFSLSAVFYIFLFLQYFKELNKVGQFLLFNVWIYLVMNPISHYYFGTTSILQLFSPFLTMGFTIFYPLEFILHLFGYGFVLDSLIENALSLERNSYLIFTPAIFFYIYLGLSFFSIWFKKIFVLLNIALVVFTGYLYI